MHDIEQRIADWRRRMLSAGIKEPVPMDELEGHLRDDVECQVRGGAAPADAFEAAVLRMGPPGALKAEFGRIGVPSAARRLKGVARYYVVVMLVYAVCVGRLLVRGSGLSLMEKAIGLAGLAGAIGAVYAGCRLAPRFLPVIHNRALRQLFQLSFGVLGAAWFTLFARFILPRFNLQPGQLEVALLWAVIPLLLAPTAFLGFDRVEGR